MLIARSENVGWVACFCKQFLFALIRHSHALPSSSLFCSLYLTASAIHPQPHLCPEIPPTSLLITSSSNTLARTTSIANYLTYTSISIFISIFILKYHTSVNNSIWSLRTASSNHFPPAVLPESRNFEIRKLSKRNPTSHHV